MSALVPGIILIVWLGLGGWAFRRLAVGIDHYGAIVAGAVLCAFLGPFMFGWAVADAWKGRKP